jgi:hypothetical protein
VRSSWWALIGVVAFLVGSGSAIGASGANSFRTPSGNIYCAYEHYSFAPIDLRCEIRGGIKPLPPKPSTCNADWGAGYSMRQSGLARVLCISDTVYDRKAKVIAYRTTWSGGGFACESRTTGLRCTSPSGAGFFLSREHSYTFTTSASKNGTFKTLSGNIVCGYIIVSSGSYVECGIKSGPRPRPAKVSCSAGDYTDKRVGLKSTGRAVPVVCAGDPGPFLYEAKAWVLPYGDTWQGGGITCSSETTGLTCTNRVGHGFFLSRARWRSF